MHDYGTAIARLYNQDWAFFSEKLTKFALTLTHGRKAVLDLGCGTGNFLAAVAPEFEKAVGVDISPDMIEIARRNVPTAEFTIGDVLSFSSDERFDLITCNFDMVNHLPSLRDFEKLFRLAHDHLERDGAFLFDFNTPREQQFCDCGDIIDESGIYRKVFREHRLDEHHIRIDISVFPRGTVAPDATPLGSLSVVESLYPANEVVAAVRRAGFGSVTLLDPDLRPTDNTDRPRLFAVCRK